MNEGFIDKHTYITWHNLTIKYIGNEYSQYGHILRGGHKHPQVLFLFQIFKSFVKYFTNANFCRLSRFNWIFKGLIYNLLNLLLFVDIFNIVWIYWSLKNEVPNYILDKKYSIKGQKLLLKIK